MSKGEKSRIWLSLRAIELVVFLLLFSAVFYFFMDGKALLNENFVVHGARYYAMASIGLYVVFFYGPISFALWMLFFDGSRKRAKTLNAAPFITIYGASLIAAIYNLWPSNDADLKTALAATVISFLILAAVNIIAPGMILRRAD